MIISNLYNVSSIQRLGQKVLEFFRFRLPAALLDFA